MCQDSTTDIAQPTTNNDTESLTVEEEGELATPIVAPKRSTWTTKPFQWIQDYVSIKPPGAHNCVYPLSDVLGYSNLSSKYQAYIAQLATECKSKSFKEVVKDPWWIDAMQLEIKALEKNST